MFIIIRNFLLLSLTFNSVIAKVSVKLDSTLSLDFENYDYVFPGKLGNASTFIIKREGEKETLLITYSHIKPIAAEKLSAFISSVSGKSKYQEIKVPDYLFYEFGDQSQHFYYSTSGIYIQIRPTGNKIFGKFTLNKSKT